LEMAFDAGFFVLVDAAVEKAGEGFVGNVLVLIHRQRVAASSMMSSFLPASREAMTPRGSVI